MAKTVADRFVETLAAAGVKRIYGIAGDTLDGLTEAIRARGQDRVDGMHGTEEAGAFAAGAEAIRASTLQLLPNWNPMTIPETTPSPNATPKILSQNSKTRR